jgi:tungstate transport system ATP-binding protein
MIYEIKNLKQIFQGKTILDIDSLSVAKGKIYSLSGPNGAGKTTLLKILAFLEKPFMGTLLYKGNKVKWNSKCMGKLRNKVVMLDQHPIMFTTTVFKNVEYGLRIRNIGTKKKERIVDETLELVGMSSFKNEPANTLSGGETQRVALARVIAIDPEVLICDEPVSSVDIENQSIIMKILRQINNEKGISIIFTTHDRLQAVSIAQGTFFMDKGKIVKNPRDNVFSVTFQKIHDEKNCIVNNDLKFRYNYMDSGKKRVIIDPEKIELCDISGDLKGRIVQIGEENQKIRVVINSGVNISVLLKTGDPILRKIFAGDQVYMNFPDNSVVVVNN